MYNSNINYKNVRLLDIKARPHKNEKRRIFSFSNSNAKLLIKGLGIFLEMSFCHPVKFQKSIKPSLGITYFWKIQ